MTKKHIKKTILSFLIIFGLNMAAVGAEFYSFHQDKEQKPKGQHLGFGFFLPKTSLFSGSFIRKNRKKLNFNEEQSQKFKKMFIKIKEFYIDNSSRLKIAELELLKLLKTADPSRRNIKKKLKDLGNLKTRIIVRQMEYLFKINDLLTDQQKEILKNINISSPSKKKG